MEHRGLAVADLLKNKQKMLQAINLKISQMPLSSASLHLAESRSRSFPGNGSTGQLPSEQIHSYPQVLPYQGSRLIDDGTLIGYTKAMRRFDDISRWCEDFVEAVHPPSSYGLKIP